MKRIFITIVSVILVLALFAGCSISKTAKTYEEFEVIAKEKGFIIYDDTASAGEKLDKLSVAVKDNTYQIEFYDFKEKSKAESSYNYIKESLDDKYSVRTFFKRITLPDYNYYYFESSDVFELVIRVGDTLLYCGTKKEYKDTVMDVVKLMEY